MANELIKHVSDASFDADVLKSTTPVLVDYWAEWCGPCKMIAPILDEVATGYAGKLQIAKMNVDENRDIPAKFGIRGIPTLMIFKDGELAATKVGVPTRERRCPLWGGLGSRPKRYPIWRPLWRNPACRKGRKLRPVDPPDSRPSPPTRKQ